MRIDEAPREAPGPCVALMIGDLMVASRVREIVRAAGGQSHAVRAVHDLVELPARADVLIVDLAHAGPQPDAFIRAVRAESRLAGLRVLGFYPHVRADLASKALTAGCDSVLPNSAFFDALPGFLVPSTREVSA